jgi:hypothetical protein
LGFSTHSPFASFVTRFFNELADIRGGRVTKIATIIKSEYRKDRFNLASINTSLKAETMCMLRKRMRIRLKMEFGMG